MAAQFKLTQEQCLREMNEGRMFYKEEMENKLRNYEVFKEGGTRIQL